MYEAFRESLGEKYVTAEEVLTVLAQVLPLSEKLKGCTMLFDGFTGFTPVQLEVMQELLPVCGRIRVTVTLDPEELLTSSAVRPHQLFFMSHRMIRSLSDLTQDTEPPLVLRGKGRFEHAPALAFLEKNLFRYKGRFWEEPQEEVQLFSAPGPEEVMVQILSKSKPL